VSRAAGVREARRLVNRSHADWEDEMLGHAHDLGHAAGVEDAAKVVDALLVSVAKVTPTSDLTSGLHAAVIEIVTDCAAAIRGLKGGGDGE